MAQITHVKKAQQRYATVPVLDTDGKQKKTPVIDKRTGQQKVSKRGPVFLTVTVADKTKPLPMPRCDARPCKHGDTEIKVGMAYKHISPKSGPYGGRTLTRHEDCPTWNVWEYSSSLSARLAQISHEAWGSFPEDAESTEDIESWLEDVATEVEALADEKDESADNIEEGFQHETSASEELREVAETLRGWAEEIRGADVPDLPEAEETDCETCEGTGKVEEECVYCSGTGDLSETVEGNEDTDPEEDCTQCEGSGETEVDCEDCDGTGQVTPEEPTDEQMDDWRDEVREAVTVIDDCPL